MSIERKRIFSDPACHKCYGRGVYFEAKADCEACNGTGDFEGYECSCVSGPARFCDCHKQQKIRVMTDKARLPKKNLGCRVQNFMPKNKSERAVRDAVAVWVTGYPNTMKPGLFIYGPTGVGKTHLAAAICQALITRNEVQPLYVSTTELMAMAIARFNNEDSLIDPFIPAAEAEVLVLDDFGAEKPSEWSLSKFMELVDGRYRREQPTIFTSNLNMASIEAMYGSRIADRIYEHCEILHCNGESRRRKENDK